MRRLLVTFAALAALSLLLAACGDDDGEVSVGDDTTTTSEAPPPIGEDPDDEDSGDDAGDETDEGDDAVDPDADRPAYSDGFELDPETGEVDVSAYQAFLAEHGAPSAGAEAAALEMLDATYAEVDAQASSEAADGGRTVVTVLYDNLPDDSVAAERFELVFVSDGDAIILESGSWASRCQPGRGHQEFATGLCL